MNKEENEDKTNAASQAVDNYQTEELTDLPVAAEQTEEIRGGEEVRSAAARATSQNNLKQIGIGVHN